ncbi:TPA: DUF1382 family protein [Escherichia coli]|nr:DUF1382 family protein [Escherichia coli]HCP6319271.1 DUF1382 family protein [Escherichia coli]
MDAQTRRRERRAEKQAQWKVANPLLVGVSAKPVIEMAHSLAQIGVRFVPIPVETDEEFHTLAASLSQKLEMMVAKAEADERDQV